jgi:hypothetical protein
MAREKGTTTGEERDGSMQQKGTKREKQSKREESVRCVKEKVRDRVTRSRRRRLRGGTTPGRPSRAR